MYMMMRLQLQYILSINFIQQSKRSKQFQTHTHTVTFLKNFLFMRCLLSS